MNSRILEKSAHNRHGWLTRMFFRNCAFIVRLYGRKDARWIWTYATLSVSVTLMSLVFLVLIAVALLLRQKLPASINPLTAKSEVILVEFAIVGLVISVLVDFHLQRFRDNVDALGEYMARSDRAKWWLELLFSVSCTAGIAILLALFGEK